jgi:UDP:flavonoid glycosyltransferase YjiC (YdhE family)
LYLSSPIGLGHARRDVSIARELRALRPDVQIDWLAQPPVTRVLAEAGEQVHPASALLASESAHLVAESGEHDLHCFYAFRNMDEILVSNFMVFQEVVERGRYDLVVSDEGWEVDQFWHDNPWLKTSAYVFMTDFVGFLPMPSGGRREADLAADYNAEMIERVERYRRVRDRAIFVGNPEDVVPDAFGPGLPSIRSWTESQFDFADYITGFDPSAIDREAVRAELGYAPDEKICIATVGGSGVGEHLLRRVIEALPEARRAIPGLRCIAVAGPRIDPASLPTVEGLEVRAYVPGLHRHLAVCDLAVVQGGLTTTMELTATQRPFLYFPLHNHFEQTFHVPHRLASHRAGRRMDFLESTPELIARAMAAELNRGELDYRPVSPNGARTAAQMIAELL